MSDHRPDLLPGIQAGVGILEDDLHPLPEAAHVFLGELKDVGTVENHLSGGGLLETEDQPSYRGLPGATLPHKPENLSTAYRKGDAIHGLDIINYPV